VALEAVPQLWRRKLNLKAKFESGSSHFSFKRLVPGAFNVRFTWSTCTALPSDSAASVSSSNVHSAEPRCAAWSAAAHSRPASAAAPPAAAAANAAALAPAPPVPYCQGRTLIPFKLNSSIIVPYFDFIGIKDCP
jgi:hypothetical protein